jgi:glycerol-3-phosphate dehydrogenase
LVTITGGKWTTYRSMAEDVLNQALKKANISAKPCSTANMKLHGYKENVDRSDWNYVYGTDAEKISAISAHDKSACEKIHPKYNFTKAQVIFAVRNELAQTVEDVLARRVRLMFLDARAAKESAPVVAEIIANELGKDEQWKENQIKEFCELADGYILK